MKGDNLTQNQLLYIDARIEGLSQRQAYLKAYPKSIKWKNNSIDRQASVLEKTPKVCQSLKERRAEAAKNADWTREKAIKRLQTVNDRGFNVLHRAVLDRDAATVFFSSLDRLNKLCNVEGETIDTAPEIVYEYEDDD